MSQWGDFVVRNLNRRIYSKTAKSRYTFRMRIFLIFLIPLLLGACATSTTPRKTIQDTAVSDDDAGTETLFYSIDGLVPIALKNALLIAEQGDPYPRYDKVEIVIYGNWHSNSIHYRYARKCKNSEQPANCYWVLRRAQMPRSNYETIRKKYIPAPKFEKLTPTPEMLKRIERDFIENAKVTYLSELNCRGLVAGLMALEVENPKKWDLRDIGDDPLEPDESELILHSRYFHVTIPIRTDDIFDKRKIKLESNSNGKARHLSDILLEPVENCDWIDE